MEVTEAATQITVALIAASKANVNAGESFKQVYKAILEARSGN